MQSSAAVLGLGGIENPLQFSANELLNAPDGAGNSAEPLYMVAIHRRSTCWAGWRPRSVEDVPPTLGDQGLYSRCQNFGEALRKTRSLNLRWLKRASGHGPAQWAIVSCIDRNALQSHAPLRTVTPLTYRSQELSVAGWTPGHLLDVPLSPWKSDFPFGVDLPVCDTLETAVHHVLALNRLEYSGRPGQVDSWHVVIAIENQPICERLEYRSWKPNEGVVSLESSRIFHVFDRLTWPVPEDVRLELSIGVPNSHT